MNGSDDNLHLSRSVSLHGAYSRIEMSSAEQSVDLVEAYAHRADRRDEEALSAKAI